LKRNGCQFLRLLTKCHSLFDTKFPTPRVFPAPGIWLTLADQLFNQPTATFLVAEHNCLVPSDRAVEAPAQTMLADQVPPPTCRLELNQCLDRARTEAERKKAATLAGSGLRSHLPSQSSIS
jgi:hypothetical protein